MKLNQPKEWREVCKRSRRKCKNLIGRWKKIYMTKEREREK